MDEKTILFENGSSITVQGDGGENFTSGPEVEYWPIEPIPDDVVEITEELFAKLYKTSL